VPILAIAPVDEPWVDVIVGLPGTSELYCIQAARSAVPLSTDIPFSFDEAFLKRARSLLKN
jgi:hypothetical protein